MDGILATEKYKSLLLVAKNKKIEYRLVEEASDSYQIYVKNKWIGQIAGEPVKENIFNMLALFVAEEYRGTGLAQRAIQEVANMYNGLQSNGRFRKDAATKMYHKIPNIKKKLETITLSNGVDFSFEHIFVPKQGLTDSVEIDSASAMKSVDANIKRGQKAITKALLEKTTVRRAMYRNDIGWIDFVWGKIGTVKLNSNKSKKGAGVEHIIESRMRKDNMEYREVVRFLVYDLVEAIAKAPINKNDIKTVNNSMALSLAYRKTFVKLVKRNGSNGWVITSFEIYDEDGTKDGYNPLSPTQDFVTLTHKELGASLDTIIPQNQNKINMDGVETMNILQKIKIETGALSKAKLLKEWKSLGALARAKIIIEYKTGNQLSGFDALKKEVKQSIGACLI